MKTLRLKIGRVCNNACAFCVARGERYDRAPEHIIRKLLVGKKDGCEAVLFTGLEPTVQPEIIRILASARDIGYERIIMDTNARMFSYKRFAREAIACGLTEARVLILHRDAAGYQETARAAPEGFDQCVAGVRNLFEDGQLAISARIPICAGNHGSLAAIVEFARALGIKKTRAYFPRDYFFEDGPFDRDALERQVEQAARFADESGMAFEFDRDSKFYHYLTEMEEGSSPSFYPAFYVGRKARPEILEAVLRPTFACNQICKFCWVDTARRKPSRERMESEIKYVIKNRVPKLGFSGGEPTLDSRIAHYIDAAKSGGVRQVEMHTNAVRLADRALCEDLRDAGLDVAYCSLLAPGAGVSDGITRTSGTFRKTVAGITNLLELSVNVVAHFVIMEDNYRLLPEFVEFVDSQFTYGGARLPITFSFVAPRDEKAMQDGIVPRFSLAMPYLGEAVAECEARGIPYCAGEGLKGVPPCVVPFREKYVKQIMPSPKNLAGSAFAKKDKCAACAYDGICFGVRRHYANYYGLDEINPVPRADCGADDGKVRKCKITK